MHLSLRKGIRWGTTSSPKFKGEQMRGCILSIVILFLVGGLIRLNSRPKKEKSRDGRYVIQYHKILKAIAIINMALYGGIFVGALGTINGVWKFGKEVTLGVVIFYGLYSIFSLICIMGINIWRITVEKEKVIYRNYFGINKIYNFKEIKVEEFIDGKIIATKNGKKIFKIDNNLDALKFTDSAMRYEVFTYNPDSKRERILKGNNKFLKGIILTEERIRKIVLGDPDWLSINRFVVKPKYSYGGVSVLGAGVFGFLVRICILRNRTGSVFFILMLIGLVVSIIRLIDFFTDRLSVKDDNVVRIRGIIVKKFRVDEIENVRLKKGLFRENLEIYVGGKCVTKVCTKNRFYEWLRKRLAKEKVKFKR